MPREYENEEDYLDLEEDFSNYPGSDMYDDVYYDKVHRFADPGGDSALHPVTSDNPRNCTCPTCGTNNVLTAKDLQSGYQCDMCADAQERGFC